MVVYVDFALLVYFDIFAMNSSGNKVKKASQKKKNKKKEEKQEQEVYISTI
jgi:large-conductance mechanosensitive channel